MLFRQKRETIVFKVFLMSSHLWGMTNLMKAGVKF